MPFDLQPILKGELLELRPLRAADFDDLFAVAADPLIWEQHPVRDRYKEERFRIFSREALESGGALIAIDTRDGRIIGSSRFHGYDEERSEVEIGWTFLARSHWGGRYNSEMKRLMLEHAFRFVDRVVFLVGPENHRSQRAVEKIGGVRVGSRLDAARRDSIVYELTAKRYGQRHVVATFFDLHSGLPREGPGDDASTAKALAMVSPPPRARILDLACGPGMQTQALAERLPDAQITALDSHQPYLDVLDTALVARGLDRRVRTVCGDITHLRFEPDSFDVIWCEGGAYIVGFESALSAWRPLLRPDGQLAVTDLVWLRPDAPDAIRQYFADEYPDMVDAATRIASIDRAGYRLVGHFTLPVSAWWEHYYSPLETRIATLQDEYADDQAAQEIMEDTRTEMDLYRKYSAYYGYEFFVMQR